MGLLILLLSSLTVTGAQAQSGECYPGQVGVGISISQWSMIYTDIVKESRGFEAISDGIPFATDAQGWPTTDARLTVLEAWPVAEWTGSIDDPEVFRPRLAGLYPARFTGQAELSEIFGDFNILNPVYDATSNTTAFTLEILPGGNNVAIISFANTRRTANDPVGSGIRDLKVVRPGFTPENAPTFNPTFLDLVRSVEFGAIRYMGYSNTNAIDPTYPETLDWNERTTPQAASYTATINGLPGSGPWEDVIALANLLDIDAWINVPASATDDYIRALAGLMRDGLEPERKLYVEYSNEVWNWAFPQSQWNLANAEGQGLNYVQGYAKRTGEIALLFQEVFGAGSLNNRVRVVNAWQIGYAPPDAQYQEQMQYINDTFGAPNSLIWALSVAPYFNCYEGSGAGCGADVPGLLAGMQESSDASVASRQLVKAVADRWQLPGGMNAYEGGSDTGLGFVENVGNRIRSARTPEMGDLIRRDLIPNWFQQGGGLFMQLELVGAYSRFGTWGLTDDATNPDRNFKMQAIRDVLCQGQVIATATPIPTTVPPTPTMEPTAPATATMEPTLLPSLTPTVVAGQATLQVIAEPAVAAPGETIQVNITLSGAANLYALETTCTVDPAVLRGASVGDGSIFTQASSFFVDKGFGESGSWISAASLLNPAPAFNGDGVAYQLAYEVVSTGTTAIQCQATAADQNGNVLDLAVVDGSFGADSTPQPTIIAPSATPEPTVIPPSATPEPTATLIPPTATPEPSIVPPTLTLEPSVLPPTLTPEPTVVIASIGGSVRYQVGTDRSGIMLTLLAGGPNGFTFAQQQTGADGSFTFDNVPAGDYALQIFGDGHLAVIYSFTVPAAGISLPVIQLRTGDTDGNQRIDLADATLIGANFLQSVPPAPANADLTKDGLIDIRDLALVGGNFGLVGPISLP
jgi:hypothetical protein